MQQQMTIGKKLALTSGWLVAAMVLVGVFSIYSLAGLNRITQEIITDQQSEIQLMQVWLKQRDALRSRPGPKSNSRE